MNQQFITRLLIIALTLGVLTDAYLIVKYQVLPAGPAKASLAAPNAGPVGQHVALLVRRDGDKLFVAVDLG